LLAGQGPTTGRKGEGLALTALIIDPRSSRAIPSYDWRGAKIGNTLTAIVIRQSRGLSAGTPEDCLGESPLDFFPRTVVIVIHRKPEGEDSSHASLVLLLRFVVLAVLVFLLRWTRWPRPELVIVVRNGRVKSRGMFPEALRLQSI